MKPFLLQLARFLLAQAALFGVCLLGYDVSTETNYLAATVDKHRQLRSAASPKVILVGGSNVAFGFESDRIEQALGRPVVNMSLAAGLGVEFMLAEIAPGLRTGDIVVLSLEYDHFARGPTGRHAGLGFDPSLLQQVLVFRPAAVFALELTHLRKVVLDRGLAILGEIARRQCGFGSRIQAAQESEVQSTRGAFNAWGDFVGHRKERSRTTPEVVDRLPLVADVRGFPQAELIDRIRQFVERSGRAGVEVVFTFTPKPTGTLQRDGELAGRLADALRNIPELTLLDLPPDHAYSPDRFFDTANHLTAEGAATRTTKVIDSLRRLIDVRAPKR